LLAEVAEALAVTSGGLYVDATVGLGGHAEEILKRSAPDGRLVANDRDGEALDLARERLAPFAARLRFVHGEYADLPEQLEGEAPNGILLDLGVSSWQLDDPERGFSFRSLGPLDMRMDRTARETAGEVVNRASERELADVIYRFGEERAARKVARAIVSARRRARIETTTELAALVRSVVRAPRHARIDPATRTFQALRIRVNREIVGLADSVKRLALTLAPGGRIAVIAFHSLEDREIKLCFRALVHEGFRLLTRRPVLPADAECRENPRARSARLRAIEREAR
jgi:16S rRNA (cytosine1402-N4)-methyltransferase